ncbi:hypothetical protein H072_10416 [Dactylellina haptotyla CBS 200.50]|uniref:tRNA-splicing endonuclease subunit Sen15 domain-containing protein n=1 Tax=Dactylellina haptotyla (strain CBS 200.50) TaxID=1284197 RepID=S7ZZW1_DACHA|nr:hypothetical protein H072_10416 [Dactylellina haptotyla CBS 200.50]
MATADGASHLLGLRSIVRSNLEYQHYWTDLRLLNTFADLNINAQGDPLTRPMIHGRPPDQLYNPEPASTTESSSQQKPTPEMEYVLPVHLDEKLTLRTWAAVFDALPTPPGDNYRKKRIVVAVISGDSTVVYYIMHDGIVKPRQN